MSDRVPIVLKDRLHVGKMGLADPNPLSPIALENSAGGRIVVDPGNSSVLVAPDLGEAIATLNEMLRGPAGPPGPEGQPGQPAPSAVYFVQPNAESVWTINHNLASYPAVTVVDTAGDQVLADLSFPNLNVAVVRFAVAMAGIAYLR